MGEPEPFVALGLSLLAAQDVLEAVLQEVNAAALCQLKSASKAWRTHARPRHFMNRALFMSIGVE